MKSLAAAAISQQPQPRTGSSFELLFFARKKMEESDELLVISLKVSKRTRHLRTH
jgi:hypothetical protein